MSKESKPKSQKELATMFVEQAKEYREQATTKSLDLDKEFQFYRSEIKDDIQAIDMLLYNNAALRARLNRQAKTELEKVSYDSTALIAEDEDYLNKRDLYEGQRAAPLDTASNPGGANVMQTTLSDTILYKVENTGQIINLVAKDEIPYGDKEYPKMSAKVAATFLDENSTDPDDYVEDSYEDAVGGLTKTKFEPRDFGLMGSFTQRLLKKITPATLAFFRNYEAIAIRRGIEQQILRGSGAGQDAEGVLSIATSITFDTNPYFTLLNAVGALAAADTENMQVVMHRKTWQEFLALRVINESYRQSIDPVNMKIDDLQVILSNNTDASVATSGNVLVGDFSHYLYARNGGLMTIEDPYTLLNKRTVRVYHGMQIDLGVLLASSFAKFSITF